MKKFKNYAVIAVGILTLAVAIAVINASHARAQGPQIVVKPGKNPPQPVQVVNPTLAVFDIDNARQPLHVSQTLVLTSCNTTEVLIATVPNDKRFVIEYISASGNLGGNNFFRKADVFTVVNGQGQRHYLVMNRLGNDNFSTFFAFSQQARLYADPGTLVRANATQGACSGGGILDVTISGYLVDVAQFVDITP